MNKVRFSVVNIAAWGPRLKNLDAWRQYFIDQTMEETESIPKLQSIKPLLRRRFDFLGKMAMEVTFDCLSELKDIPIVFCSRHGEIKRSTEILEAMAKNEPVSPTQFSLSVHNAIAGLFSIITSNKTNTAVISAKENMTEQGVIEACSLLNDGEKQVLLVVYNETPPEIYQSYHDRIELPFAWACLIEKPSKNPISLSWKPSSVLTAKKQQKNLPDDLEVLRFLINNEASLQSSNSRQTWLWNRNVS